MDLTKLPTPAYFLIAFAVFLMGWYLPITRMKDPNATKNSKTVWSFWLIIFGVAPIIYTAVMTYKAYANPSTPNMMNNSKPNLNMPSNVGGSKTGPSPSVGAPLIPAPPAPVPIYVANPGGNNGIAKQN
jgi:hypothetical protein